MDVVLTVCFMEAYG